MAVTIVTVSTSSPMHTLEPLSVTSRVSPLPGIDNDYSQSIVLAIHRAFAMPVSRTVRVQQPGCEREPSALISGSGTSEAGCPE